MLYKALCSALGELVLQCFALVFFVMRIPRWVKQWFRRKRRRSDARFQTPSVPPQVLADPSLGRHMFIKIKVGDHK